MTSKSNRTWRVHIFRAVLLLPIVFQTLPPTPLALYATGQTAASHRQRSGNARVSDRLAVSTPVTSVNGDMAARSSTESDAYIFTFFPSVWYNTGGYGNPGSTWIEMGDLNGDGNPDLVVLTCIKTYPGCGAHSVVGVLLGNGDGTFQAIVTYDSGGYSAESHALADVNGDGNLDIVASNCGSESDCFGHGSVGVLLGNGDGTFQPVVTYDVGSLGATGVQSVVIADVNSDSKPDLVVATGHCATLSCQTNPEVVVLLGNGDGTFQSPVGYSSGGSSASSIANSIAIADVNGDHKLDVVVANCNTNLQYCDGNGSIGVLLGNGDGTFQPVVTYASGGADAASLAVADLNRDGKADLVVVNRLSETMGVLLGKGDGSFQAAAIYSPIGQFPNNTVPVNIRVSDVNGDGIPDLAVGANGVGVLLGNGDGTFGPVVTYNPDLSVEWVAIADVNGDGRPDIAFVNNGGNAGVLLNNSGAPATTISLVVSVNPVTVNQPVTYTATVTAPNGVVPKAIVFLDEFYSYPPTEVPLIGNQASETVTYPTTVTQKIKAVYPGDLNTASAAISSILTENVRGTSMTVVTTSGSPSILGHPVTFAAKISSKYGAIPDGDVVTFTDGTVPLGSGSLSGGQAVFSTSGLSAGLHAITAAYSGDTTFAASTGTVRQVVKPSPTTISFTSSLDPSTYGLAVTFTATVIGSGPIPPTGQVAFSWSGNTIGSAMLNSSGVAVLTTSKLTAGIYPLMAIYRGDANNLTSTSPALNQTVLQAKSKATIASSMNPSTVGQAVTFTAKIASPTVTPTGPVTFSLGKTILGTAQLSKGKATFTTSSLGAGSNAIKVTYQGNSNIASSSAVVTQIVQ